jgi:hypothetical protein
MDGTVVLHSIADDGSCGVLAAITVNGILLATRATRTDVVHSLHTSADACSVIVGTQRCVEIVHLHSLEAYATVAEEKGARTITCTHVADDESCAVLGYCDGAISLLLLAGVLL